MQPLRSALRKHPVLVAAILMAALTLRIVIPAGFMPVFEHGRVTLTLCSGVVPAPTGTSTHAGNSHAAPQGTSHHQENQGKTYQNSCAFLDLAVPVIGGADPVQLAAALLFIVAAALFLCAALPRSTARRLRPPLRGPPLPIG